MGGWIAFAFFISFALIVTFLLTNLFLGVLLKSFEDYRKIHVQYQKRCKQNHPKVQLTKLKSETFDHLIRLKSSSHRIHEADHKEERKRNKLLMILHSLKEDKEKKDHP